MTRFALGILLLWTSACTPSSEPAKPAARVEPTPPAEPVAPAVATKPAPPAPVAKPPAPPVPAAKPVEPEPTAPAVEPDTQVFVEEIGGLRLGMTPDEVLAVMPKLVTDGKVTQVTPDSLIPGPRTYYTQEFVDDVAGVSIEMRSKTAEGTKRAASLGIARQSAAKTKQGIGIGSTRAAVKKAYPKAITPIDEMWVRFSDDEMLMFIFDDQRRVEGISLGPAMDPDDLEE